MKWDSKNHETLFLFFRGFTLRVFSLVAFHATQSSSAPFLWTQRTKRRDNVNKNLPEKCVVKRASLQSSRRLTKEWVKKRMTGFSMKNTQRGHTKESDSFGERKTLQANKGQCLFTSPQKTQSSVCLYEKQKRILSMWKVHVFLLKEKKETNRSKKECVSRSKRHTQKKQRSFLCVSKKKKCDSFSIFLKPLDT